MLDNLLALSEVLKQIGWSETKHRSAMLRYTALPPVDALLGATQVGKYTKYPLTRIWLFREIALAHDRAELSPKDAEAFLRSRIDAGPTFDADHTVIDATEFAGGDRMTGSGTFAERNAAPDDRSTALAPITAQVERLGGVFADTIIARIKESGILPVAAPLEDRLIGREEVAEMIGLADRPHLVSRRVAPVAPGLWSRVQVLRYIEGLRDVASAKTAARRRRGKAGEP